MACDPVVIIPSLACCTSQSSSISIQGRWAGMTSFSSASVIDVRYLRIRTSTVFIPFTGPFGSYAGGSKVSTADFPKWRADFGFPGNAISETIYTGDYHRFLSPGNWLYPGQSRQNDPGNVFSSGYTKTNLYSRFNGINFPQTDLCGYSEQWLESPWPLDDALQELIAQLLMLNNWPGPMKQGVYAYDGLVAALAREDDDRRSPRSTAEIQSPGSVSGYANNKDALIVLKKYRNALGRRFCRWVGTTSGNAVTSLIECAPNLELAPDTLLPTAAILTPVSSGSQWQKTLIQNPIDAGSDRLSYLSLPAAAPSCCAVNPFT